VNTVASRGICSLHYVAVCVSNLQGRCIVVILLHVQSLLDACPVGSEELDDVGVQQVVHILAHADVDLRGRYSWPSAPRSFRPGSSRQCTSQRSLGRSRGTFLLPTGGSCEACRSSTPRCRFRPPARELPSWYGMYSSKLVVVRAEFAILTFLRGNRCQISDTAALWVRVRVLFVRTLCARGCACQHLWR